MVTPCTCRYPVAMADIFDVIADANRRDILRSLLEEPATSTQIKAKLGLEDAAKQIAVLAKAGLLVSTGEGAKKTWSVDPAPLQDVDGWLVPFLEAAGAFATDGGGSVFGAWSGSDAGETLGRAVADRSHQARVVIEDASELIKSRLPKTVTDRLGKKPTKGA